VTTEITGEGESIAPVNDRILKEQEDFNRRYNLTVDWRTLGEYFTRLDRQGAGVNLGTFVGATQVREYVIGYDNRPPTAAELEQMKKLVADAMKDGALGVRLHCNTCRRASRRLMKSLNSRRSRINTAVSIFRTSAAKQTRLMIR
jgi:N-acyl-D-aspartate/D-glutamate deacylase